MVTEPAESLAGGTTTGGLDVTEAIEVQSLSASMGTN